MWSLTISQLVYRLVSLVLAVYMARSLGASDLGIYYTVTSLIAIFTAFIDLGMTNFIIKEVSRNRTKTHEYLNTFFTLQGIIGSLFIGIILLSGNLLGYSEIMMQALIIASVSPLLSGLANCFSAILSGQELLYPFAIIEIVCLIFFAAANVVVIVLGMGVLAFVLVMVLNSVIKVALAFWWGSKFRLHVRLTFDRTMMKQLLYLGLPFLFINGIHLALQRVDVVYLSLFVQQEQVGHYAAASRLIFSAIFFISVLAAVLYPTLARLLPENRVRVEAIATVVTKFILFASLGIALVCTLAADWIIPFLYGQNFGESIRPFILIAWFIPIFGFGSMYGNMLIVGGRVWTVVSIHLSALLLLTLCAFTLIPRFGIEGMAWSLLISETFRSLFYILAIKKHFHFSIPILSALKIVIATLAGFYVGGMISSYSLPLSVAVGTAILSVGAFTTGVITITNVVDFRNIFFARFRTHSASVSIT